MQTLVLYALAVILTIEQAFDCISTNLILSKGRGHEGNGLIAKWMGLVGWWWWSIKVPLVLAIWWMVYAYGADPYLRPPMIAMLAMLAAIYAAVLINNYRIAWRH